MMLAGPRQEEKITAMDVVDAGKIKAGGKDHSDTVSEKHF